MRDEHQHAGREAGDWRSIVLQGANTASYKFALAHSLLTLSQENATDLTLRDLAPHFAEHTCRHLVVAPVQSTAPRSLFLDACIAYNRDDATWEELVDATRRLAFRYVLDAFHNVGSSKGTRFYERHAKGITLTDELFRLGRSAQGGNLVEEVEARWQLVEASWETRRQNVHLTVCCDVEKDVVRPHPDQWRFVRRNVAKCRAALNGYQQGRCFYCAAGISVDTGARDVADVDHFVPFSLQAYFGELDLNGLWNLVLACSRCNRRKRHFLAPRQFLNQIDARNEWLLASHRPLRPTLINITGSTPTARQRFLRAVYQEAESHTHQIWEPDRIVPDFI